MGRRELGTRCWQLVKSSGLTPNPNEVSRRASSFAAAAEQLGAVTLLALRDETGLSGFIITPVGESADQAALHLAQTVAARADEIDACPPMGRATYGVLVAKAKSATTRDSQVGSDTAEVARRLFVSMRPGSWVAASLRRPSGTEVRRVRRWYEHRLGTANPVHHSVEDNAIVMSLTAGAASADEVRSMLTQVAAALPGFDVETTVDVVTLGKSMFPWIGAGVAAWAGTIALHPNPFLATAIGGPPVLIGAGIAAGKLPSRSSRLDKEILDGTLAPPPKRIIPPRKPIHGSTNQVPGTKSISSSPGGYPLAAESFLIGPSVIVGLVSPHAGASSGAAQTERRSASGPLLEQIGPSVGTAGDIAAVVHISAADAWSGTAFIGQAGSGKTQALRCLFGWNCLERTRPSGKPGFPGSQNALIAFESKGGDDADFYRRWAETAGDKTLLIEFADPSTWGIDILAVPGTTAERAAFATNAMVYTFEQGAIQGRSFEALVHTITAALAITDEVAAEAELPGGMSTFWYTYILLAGEGDAKAVKLAGAIDKFAKIAEAAADARSLPSGRDPVTPVGPMLPLTDLGIAVSHLATYFGGKATENTRRGYFEAPRNKLAQLVAAEQWWSPSRSKVTWDQVLDGHRSIIINTGTSRSGRTVASQLNQQMSSMLMFSLQEAIARRCVGWQEKGRSVTIFSDELSLVAGTSPEIIAWLKNQGRSYGIRSVFATQYPEQLSDQVRAAFLGFGTIFWFAQGNPDIAAQAAADLSLDGSDWTPADVAGLAPFTAIIRSYVNQLRQPPVPVKLGYWESNMSAYPGVQGYGSGPVVGAP